MGQIYIEDKPYGIKDALRIIGIDSNFIPKRRERVFEPPQEFLRKDTLNGGYRYPKRTGIQPQFSVFSKELDREVTVRYATSSRPVVQNGLSTMSYQPIQLFINGEAEFVADDVEFMFRYVHPSCKQSPLRKLSSDPYTYVYRNTEQEAADELFKDELKIKALSIIIGDNAKPIHELRRILKGFGEGGVDLMEEATVKKQLKDRANADPEKFIITVSAKDFQFKAMVRDAVDSNIFTITTENGYHRFHYEGQEVHIVSASLDAFSQLTAFVADNLNKYYFPLQEKLAGKTLDAKLNLPENANFFHDPVVPEDISVAQAGKEVRSDMIKDQIQEEKLKKLAYWASLDPNDPTLHASTKKALERNAEAIQEYKKVSLKT